MNDLFSADSEGISGVYEARQKRSIKMRDAYIAAGIELLGSARLDDLHVPDLARHCGYSVGGFYTRFKDKQAFFHALQVSVSAWHRQMALERVGPDRLPAMPPAEALEAFIDLMSDIFTGPSRGVLRESLLMISDSSDPWAQMRESGRIVCGYLLDGLTHRLTHLTPEEADNRLKFAYQTVVGVLQNDLVNGHLPHSTRDGSLCRELKVLIRAYVGLDA